MPHSTAESDTLSAALARQAIKLAPEQVDLLDRYCRLLWEWNEKLNLTRHLDYERFVARDVVDSLQLSQLIESGERVLDVGSGGGVPGVVLAVLRSDLAVVLSESVAKKARALTDIVERLSIDTPVHHARAEQLLESEQFDTLVIRAVAPLYKLMQWFGPCRASFDQLLIVKGPNWTAERAEARHRGVHAPFNLRRAASYKTPGTEAESVILRVWAAEIES
jgi:16S rRNA (guanine527-N7)-methyltransferase